MLLDGERSRVEREAPVGDTASEPRFRQIFLEARLQVGGTLIHTCGLFVRVYPILPRSAPSEADPGVGHDEDVGWEDVLERLAEGEGQKLDNDTGDVEVGVYHGINKL